MCSEWRLFGASTFIALLLATMSTLLLNMENGAKRNGFPESSFPICTRILSEGRPESYNKPTRRTNLNEIKKRENSSPVSTELPDFINETDIDKSLTKEELAEEIISFGVFLTDTQAYTAHSHLIIILKKSYYHMMEKLWKSFKTSASEHDLPDEVQKKLWTECAISLKKELYQLEENSKEDISSFLKKPIIFFIQFENFLGECIQMWHDSIDQNRKKWERVLSQRVKSYSCSG
ncbi:RAD protein [Plasmodium cynomolgi strain B]|uniref:RAD protein n=1 Tax=Plasmodium cynomolgi (strain B) TaxID=1120755 RepID=K6UT38_PLACD|nr:RAD protein [Plasmodium cynomolgi strain B]GAB65210.1 RAD protein [Plasmodium cynomolgi strain B]